MISILLPFCPLEIVPRAVQRGTWITQPLLHYWFFFELLAPFCLEFSLWASGLVWFGLVGSPSNWPQISSLITGRSWTTICLVKDQNRDGFGGVPRRRRNPLGSTGGSWNPLWIWSGRIFKMLLLSNEVAPTFFYFFTKNIIIF